MPKSQDIVLVSPGNQAQIYQSLAESLTAKEPPVWAGLLGSYLKNKGKSVSIIDAAAEELSPQETAKRITKANPKLVALVIYGHQPSASTQVMPGARAVCNAMKSMAPDVPVMMLGGHVDALPERTIKEERADFVCAGEGPATLVSLLEALENGTDLW
jgi:radical SAM superfamily enzyme YgiQ (UPF0313 family)